MPDTHDERGGDEAALLLAIRRRALTASTYAEWHQVGRDIETLGQKLANATARAKKAEALVAGLHEEWGYRFGVGCGEDGFDSETTARLIAAPGDRIVHRLVGEWRGAPDAAQDGLSATETDADGVQGSADGRTPVRASAELSGRCRATKLDEGVRHHCDDDKPHTTHECGDCAHRWDDTTEDGQHG